MQVARHHHRFTVGATLFAAFLAAGPVRLRGADPPKLTPDEKEAFLRTAKIEKVHEAKKGITGTLQVTLNDGKTTHDASVQRIHETKPVFQGADGTSEINFKDFWEYNVAAWKLSRLLGIDDMIPPSVERKYQGTSAAFTWWIEDILMDEADRKVRKLSSPDADHWNAEMYVVRVFDQLMYNADRSLPNLMIDKQWRIWMIDHSRSFRLHRTLKAPGDLVQCDRSLLAKLKALDQATVEKELKPYLNKEEVKGLIARRDLIVKFFEGKGESVLYDRPPRT